MNARLKTPHIAIGGFGCAKSQRLGSAALRAAEFRPLSMVVVDRQFSGSGHITTEHCLLRETSLAPLPHKWASPFLAMVRSSWWCIHA